MTDKEKLKQIKTRISDLGFMIPDAVGLAVALKNHPNQKIFFNMLWRRLCAIREIVLEQPDNLGVFIIDSQLVAHKKKYAKTKRKET